MATEHNQMGEQVIAILKDAKTGEVKQIEKTGKSDVFEEFRSLILPYLLAHDPKTVIKS